jgi:uncharacterized protein YbbC (DUF1343 family)
MLCGLDRLPHQTALVDRLRSCRVGLLAHPASVNHHFEHVSQVLKHLQIVPTILFGPEHGYGGEAQDMIGVPDARDKGTNAPIVSLYGDQFSDLSPTPEHLANMDILLIDLMDIGSRYYTYIWTALLVVRAAVKAGISVVILDRPNPLGTRLEDVEGALQLPGYLSFVGLEPIPVRHSLTLAEIVTYFAQKEGIPLGTDGGLMVVATQKENSDGIWADDQRFVYPSPNMPTLSTAFVYPGGCLLEGTNLSDGRGLTKPFEVFGAPYVDGQALAERMNQAQLPGCVFRPLTFLPMFHKHHGKICGGVQVHVLDRRVFRPYQTYLAMIGSCYQQAPNEFRFREERYEFVSDIPAFDLLTGSDQARKAILAGEDVFAMAAEIARPPAVWQECMQTASMAALKASQGVR